MRVRGFRRCQQKGVGGVVGKYPKKRNTKNRQIHTVVMKTYIVNYKAKRMNYDKFYEDLVQEPS